MKGGPLTVVAFVALFLGTALLTAIFDRWSNRKAILPRLRSLQASSDDPRPPQLLNSRIPHSLGDME